jgi:hypothetical protein
MEAPPQPTTGARILVCDDEPQGFDVATTASGADALVLTGSPYPASLFTHTYAALRRAARDASEPRIVIEELERSSRC